jgi:hypothetical protein
MWGTALSLGAGLVSSGVQAFGKRKHEQKYMDYLKSKGMTDADVSKGLNTATGQIADQTDRSKFQIDTGLLSQNMGSSIIGSQAKMGAEMDKNKMIQKRSRELYEKKRLSDMKREQEMAQFKLGQGQAKAQGWADLGSGIAGGAGMYFDWMKGNKK